MTTNEHGASTPRGADVAIQTRHPGRHPQTPDVARRAYPYSLRAPSVRWVGLTHHPTARLSNPASSAPAAARFAIHSELAHLRAPRRNQRFNSATSMVATAVWLVAAGNSASEVALLRLPFVPSSASRPWYPATNERPEPPMPAGGLGRPDQQPSWRRRPLQFSSGPGGIGGQNHHHHFDLTALKRVPTAAPR